MKPQDLLPWAALATMLVVSTGFALPPDKVFERAAPAIWALRTLDADGKILATGTALATGPGKLMTSCQLLARARKVEVSRANAAVYQATLQFPDAERDLCQLSVEGLSVPLLVHASARALRPGQRVYVIGYARPTEQALFDGLISALRDVGSESERVQTTAPAMRGLLGAGLFDEEARLVGIVTASAKDAQSVTFALPADWLADVPKRGAAALAKRSEPVATGAPGMPLAGTMWRYQFVDRQYSRAPQEFVVRAVHVDGTAIRDTMSTSSLEAQPAAFQGPEPRFLQRNLSAGHSLVELAPYVFSADSSIPRLGISRPKDYPNNHPQADWSISVAAPEWESVTLPAGTYKALRISISGRRSIMDTNRRTAEPSNFQYSVWYVSDIGRYVMIRHKAATEGGASLLDQVVELLEYKPG